MIEETIYSPYDLEYGECSSCGELTDEIQKGDGRCLDCIESEKFYEMTMASQNGDRWHPD